MHKHSHATKSSAQPSRALTAQRMADAVTFLIRVSDEAGMHSVTKTLEAVRGKLRRIELLGEDQDANDGAPKGTMQ